MTRERREKRGASGRAKGNAGEGEVKREERSFSPQRHRRQTRARLVLGGMLVLLLVGGGLVWLFYGRAAAFTAVLCLLGAAAVMALLWLILTLLEKWVKDEEP